MKAVVIYSFKTGFTKQYAYFKGRLRYKLLNIIDKCLIQVMKISIKLKKDEDVSKNEKDILEALNKYEVSFLNRGKIIPLIEYIKSINNN